MHKIRPLLLLAPLSMAGGVWMFSVFGNPLASGQDGSKKTTIGAEALSRGDYEIIGRLGKPYGEISQVRAVWEEANANAPKPDLVFRITHVDGKELAKEKQIEVSSLFTRSWNEPVGNPIEPGDVFEGRVYESGGYVCPPAIVRKILRGPNAPVVAEPYGFKFYSFVYHIDEESFQKARAPERTDPKPKPSLPR